FGVREKAYAELLSLGASALGLLKETANHPVEEVRLRVADLRRRIEEKDDALVQAAVARLIGQHKPAGAAEVLLAYCPFAADDAVMDAITTALAQVAFQGGKADPAVIASLTAKTAVQRGVAAAALVQAGAKE